MGTVKLIFDPSDPKSISKTEQSHKNACDINKIMARALKSGVLPVRTSKPIFGDFSNLDFQAMQNKVISGQLLFMSLPAEVRAKFNNDVCVLLDWVAKPENLEEARKLGLVPPRSKQEDNDLAEQARLAAAAKLPPGSPPDPAAGA